MLSFELESPLDILQARLEGKQITWFMNIFQHLESEYEPG
jgi:hypothetical protein